MGHRVIFALFFAADRKSPTHSNRASLNRSLAMSYSHMGPPTLPSALLRFTSEFGMESGGTTALLSLNKKVQSWKFDINGFLFVSSNT